MMPQIESFENPTKAIANRAVDRINARMTNLSPTHGLSSGYRDFDLMTDGLPEGEIVVIASRPGMGKSAFVMKIAEHVVCKLDRAALVFTNGASAVDTMTNSICRHAGVPYGKLRSKYARKEDIRNITRAASQLAASKLLLDDTPDLSIQELQTKARESHHKQALDLIVVDDILHMCSTSPRAKEDRQFELAEIVKGLKALAKELNIPVIVTVQLNRKTDTRHDHRPRIADIREAGTLEAEAHLIALLTQAAYYASDDEEREFRAGEATLIIAKNKSGPIGDIPLTFIGDIMQFRDRALIKEDESFL